MMAVLLRVAIRGPESIRDHPDGNKVLLNIFGIPLCVVFELRFISLYV
jgi:hypothetical protein